MQEIHKQESSFFPPNTFLLVLCENKCMVGWHLKEQNPRLAQVRFYRESGLRIVRVSVAFLVPCLNFPLSEFPDLSPCVSSLLPLTLSAALLTSPQSSVPVNWKDGCKHRYKETESFEMRCFPFSIDLTKWLPSVVYTFALSQLLVCDRFYHRCFRSRKCFHTWLHIKE